MTHGFVKHLALTSVLVVVVACTVADSESVRTDGMAAYMEVVAHGDGKTEVDVWLAAGSGLNAARIELTGDDRLFANNGSRAQQLTQTNNPLLVSYHTTLDGDSINRRYEVDFKRRIDASTYSWTMLPEPFEITYPAPGAKLDGEGFQMRWQTTGVGSLRLHVDTDCYRNSPGHYRFFGNQTFTLSDDGEHYLDIRDLLEKSRYKDPYSFDGCEITLTLDSRQNGALDHRFGEGGLIQGIQRRIRQFSFQPTEY